jgi:hypothetical protein
MRSDGGFLFGCTLSLVTLSVVPLRYVGALAANAVPACEHLVDQQGQLPASSRACSPSETYWAGDYDSL